MPLYTEVRNKPTELMQRSTYPRLEHFQRPFERAQPPRATADGRLHPLTEMSSERRQDVVQRVRTRAQHGTIVRLVGCSLPTYKGSDMSRRIPNRPHNNETAFVASVRQCLSHRSCRLNPFRPIGQPCRERTPTLREQRK